MPNQEFLDLFQEFLKFMDNRSKTYGQLGIIENGQKIVKVPGKRNYHFVRVFKPTGASVNITKNTRTAPEYDLWVEMKTDNGVLVVTDTADDEALASLGPSGPNLLVPPHSHRRGTSLYDRVEGPRFEPGGIELDSDLGGYWVRVEALNHASGYFPGKRVNLSSYRPASAVQKKWVAVGIDRATNDVVIGEGDLMPISAQMNDSDASLVTLTGTDVLPSGAIVLRGDQTVLTRGTKLVDLRYWAGGKSTPSGSPGGGASLPHWSVTYDVGTDYKVVSSDSPFIVDGFDLEVIDTNGFVTLGTNDDRATIPSGYDGTYIVGANFEVDWDSTVPANTVLRIDTWMVMNSGNTQLASDIRYPQSTGAGSTSQSVKGTIISPPVELTAGDYVRVRMKKTEGGGNDVDFAVKFWGMMITEPA